MNTKGTTTAVLDEPSVAQEQPAPKISPFDLAVAKVIEETGRPRYEAVAGVEFIRKMAGRARIGERCGTVGTHHLTTKEMATVGYAVMDEIMPHGQAAAEGSAHAAVLAEVLGPEEFDLRHSNPTGEREDCVVTVNLGFVS